MLDDFLFAFIRYLNNVGILDGLSLTLDFYNSEVVVTSETDRYSFTYRSKIMSDCCKRLIINTVDLEDISGLSVEQLKAYITRLNAAPNPNISQHSQEGATLISKSAFIDFLRDLSVIYEASYSPMCEFMYITKTESDSEKLCFSFSNGCSIVCLDCNMKASSAFNINKVLEVDVNSLGLLLSMLGSDMYFVKATSEEICLFNDSEDFCYHPKNTNKVSVDREKYCSFIDKYVADHPNINTIKLSDGIAEAVQGMASYVSASKSKSLDLVTLSIVDQTLVIRVMDKEDHWLIKIDSGSLCIPKICYDASRLLRLLKISTRISSSVSLGMGSTSREHYPSIYFTATKDGLRCQSFLAPVLL